MTTMSTSTTLDFGSTTIHRNLPVARLFELAILRGDRTAGSRPRLLCVLQAPKPSSRATEGIRTPDPLDHNQVL